MRVMSRRSLPRCRLCLAIWTASLLALHAGSELMVEVVPSFGGEPLRFDSLQHQIASGQFISVTRLDLLLSNVSLEREDGVWVGLTNWQGYISGRENRTRFTLPQSAATPACGYRGIRFLVGLTPDLNQSDPAQFPPGHPLNPEVNGLHWGWQGGYVFLALEGKWLNGATEQGYSFHLAREAVPMELPLQFGREPDQVLRLNLDLQKVFGLTNSVVLTESESSTHSRPNDTLADLLRNNL